VNLMEFFFLLLLRILSFLFCALFAVLRFCAFISTFSSQHTHGTRHTLTERERERERYSVSHSFVLSLLPTLLVDTVSIPKRE
jgi:hypothetical protein